MLILAAVLAIFVYGMIAAMLGTILPDLSDRFKLTPQQNGTIALTQALGLVLASVFVGPLIDLQGVKIGLVLGLALITLALFLLPRSSGYGQIALYMFILGVGGGIIVVGANTLGGFVSGESRSATLNMLNLFFGLGGFATPFIGANLLKRDSTKLCYLVAALTAVTLIIHIITPMPAPAGVASFSMADAQTLLGTGKLWLLAFFLFLYVGTEVGVWNWLPRHLIAQGVPEKKALNILSLGFALGLLLGRVAVTPLFKTMTPDTVTLGASIAMAITTFLMLRTNNPTVAWVAVFLAGISMAPVFPTTLAITGDTFKTGTATATGIVVTFGWIGLAVSSRIIGAIAGPDPKRLRTALLVLPAASVLMIVLNFIILGAR